MQTRTLRIVAIIRLVGIIVSGLLSFLVSGRTVVNVVLPTSAATGAMEDEIGVVAESSWVMGHEEGCDGG
ncbi:hypothetical protein [Roseomonas sp. BN140053]|uniref:hypothetical protein n=1 Tax=Roseomonas sp. BN140053 TaxID=3391898 RepID=UPI0039ECCB67